MVRFGKLANLMTSPTDKVSLTSKGRFLKLTKALVKYSNSPLDQMDMFQKLKWAATSTG